MPITVSTNPSSLAAQRRFSIAREQTEHALLALSSGSRIVHARDDVAEYAIAEHLRAQMSGLKQAKNNAENATSMIQVAEGSLNEQSNILIRLRELAVQAASDNVSDEERGFLATEFNQLSQEFDRIAKNTRFGSQKLLTGESKEYQFQVGAYGDEDNVIRYTMNADSQASTLGVDGLSVAERDDASDALENIDSAIAKISGYRANFGSIQERLQFASSNADVGFENIAAARSRLVDTDVAEESSNLVQGQILQNIATSVLAQANQQPEHALRLLS